MEWMEIGVLALVFVATASAAYWLGQLLQGRSAQLRTKRLLEDNAQAPSQTSWIEHVARNTQALAKLSTDEDNGAQNSALRRRLFNAGIRHAAAPTAFFGTKTLLAVALPALAMLQQLLMPRPLQGSALLLLLLCAAALGYYLPNLLLGRRVGLRQREIFESFPDALDLMTICVEAGLGLDAAMQRVADDLRHRSRVLSEELQLVGLELRAGAPRERALHNLALRTGVEEVDGFVSMVLQAEHFGTSIGQALRVQADMLRTRRRQQAEETAARVALKLLFPLVFCILPALLLVVIGPAALRIASQLPALGSSAL